ncbi:TetR/AcrR family transcriptional regulator [Methylocapsa sp. S129]|uniref:TetR/AcrR family transcriptional regulator n=1 Tax=Methylocapsa sp. S129 TaxID=1641869 RepID=UPI00131BD3E6|nr:TetR/AcrR family transcriptional regulator [Methylocapsa sp. S129]
MVEECATTRLRPRDRIAGAARDLFHRHGIRGIGVDAIAEAAGTNKMTLYRHFGSKDDLIIQCLRDVALEAEHWWVELETDHPGDPLAQLHAWIAGCAECVFGDDRGCDLANAAVELAETDHPARRVIEEIKTKQRNRLANLCREAGIAQADLLADTLSLLLEGARVSRQSVGVEGPSAKFVRMCEAIIASFQNPKSAERRREAPAMAAN